MSKKIVEEDVIRYPRIILGLDVSTTCIGASILKDDGTENKPEILKLTQIPLKVKKKKNAFETLILKDKFFKETFIENIKDYGITDVVIEEPLLSSNNTYTVATLLRFNGMISETVYDALGVAPNFISSYDARMYSFPELVSLRKYNKKGEEYDLKHIKSDIKKDHIVLFGAYPFDIDKKSVMMNMINEQYEGIKWIYNEKNGELKKENFDACDSIICSLAYININHYGIEKPTIANYSIDENEKNITIEYTTKIWNKQYNKKLVLKTKD